MKGMDIGDVGNYYGGLSIMEQSEKYFWSIENWDGHNWVEIPESLYTALKAYEEGREK